MKIAHVVIGVLAVAALVASEVLGWGLSSGVAAMLGALAGWVTPTPSAIAAQARKPKTIDAESSDVWAPGVVLGEDDEKTDPLDVRPANDGGPRDAG